MPKKAEMAEITNREGRRGTLADVLKGADVFIGVSAPGCVTPEMVRSMNPNPILFPMANPVPEIMPDLARKRVPLWWGTGRSDFANQINNVLAFPGIFRGALDVRASDINDEMKIAAAHAIADFVTDDKLSPDYIIPSALDRSVSQAVAAAVAEAARKTGVAGSDPKVRLINFVRWKTVRPIGRTVFCVQKIDRTTAESLRWRENRLDTIKVIFKI